MADRHNVVSLSNSCGCRVVVPAGLAVTVLGAQSVQHVICAPGLADRGNI